MVEFLLAVGSVGMLYQRFTDAVRRGRDGNRTRRSLFCSRLSLVSRDIAERVRPAVALGHGPLPSV